MMAEDMAEKKLRGSGGYAIAKVNDDEQKMANLWGPELFLAGIGRLDNDRFVKYFCNKCEREFEGAPVLSYENPNEDLGEGVTLIEKGEYKCRACNATIAQYRKFNAPAQPSQVVAPKPEKSFSSEEASLPLPASATMSMESDGFISIAQLVGMSAYDSEAILVGKIEEVGLRKQGGRATISVKITSSKGDKNEVTWEGISKIGDIILLKGEGSPMSGQTGKCPACGYQNEAGSIFCEECGAKL